MKTYDNNRHRLRSMFTLIIGMLIGMMVTTIIAVNLLQTQAAEYEIKLEGSAAELAQKDLEISQMRARYEHELATCAITYGVKLTSIEVKKAQLQELYDTLLNDISTYEGDISFNTLSKYWYVFKMADPDCGLTTGMVQLADDLCREKDLNPDVIWTIIRFESRYYPSAQNTITKARGLGQIIEGTGRFVYENHMGNGKGTYTHDMAYNGYTNLKIMISYIGYLRDYYGDLRAIINQYSGDPTGKYYDVFVGYMQEFGHDLTDLTYAGQHTT